MSKSVKFHENQEKSSKKWKFHENQEKSSKKVSKKWYFLRFFVSGPYGLEPLFRRGSPIETPLFRHPPENH